MFRGRFADVVRRQLAFFERDDADYLRGVDAAEEAYHGAGRGDSEELYGDYMELVEAGTEALAEMRDRYAHTLDTDEAEEYVRAFNRAVRKHWPHFALEIEET